MTTSDLQQRIRDAWTRGAPYYDADPGHGLLSATAQAGWADALRDALGADPLDVLDVGTGTGLLAVIAAQLGHRVAGLDLTPAMLDGARRRAEAAAVVVDWQEGDAQALPFPDDRFDAVISRHVLWTMPDPASALREWIRVTRPGGRVLWFDAVTAPAGIGDKARGTVARLLRRLSREPDHAAPHHYAPDMYAQLPLRGVDGWKSLRSVLAQVGADDPSFRYLPHLARAEHDGWALHRRLGARSRRYVGSFVVPDAAVADTPS